MFPMAEFSAYVFIAVVVYALCAGLLYLVSFTRSSTLFRIVAMLGIGSLSFTSRSFSESSTWPDWGLPVALLVLNAPLVWLAFRGLPDPDL